MSAYTGHDCTATTEALGAARYCMYDVTYVMVHVSVGTSLDTPVMMHGSVCSYDDDALHARQQ